MKFDRTNKHEESNQSPLRRRCLLEQSRTICPRKVADQLRFFAPRRRPSVQFAELEARWADLGPDPTFGTRVLLSDSGAWLASCRSFTRVLAISAPLRVLANVDMTQSARLVKVVLGRSGECASCSFLNSTSTKRVLWTIRYWRALASAGKVCLIYGQTGQVTGHYNDQPIHFLIVAVACILGTLRRSFWRHRVETWLAILAPSPVTHCASF
jgi:hypothetical protein